MRSSTREQRRIGVIGAAVAAALLAAGVLFTESVAVDPASSYSWSRTSQNSAVFEGGSVADVTVGGPGLVAIGGTSLGPAAWTSIDGITWARVPEAGIPPRQIVVGPQARQMLSVTAGGPGPVAVGWEWRDNNADAAVWTSVDGTVWSPVPRNDEVLGGSGEQWMGSVTGGGPGLVAVGWESSAGSAHAAVWTSTDGFNWTRVPHIERTFGGPGEQWMASVTAGGPGLVAAGREQVAGDSDAAIWTSIDGFDWSRVDDIESVLGGPGQQGIEGLTARGSGLVAVGFDEHENIDGGAVWTSADGSVWSRSPHDDTLLGSARLTSVAATDSVLIAVGNSAANRLRELIIASTDGITWSTVVLDERLASGNTGLSMSTVTAGGTGLVAVGSGIVGIPTSIVWVATPTR